MPLSKGEKLQKISNMVFREADPPKNQSRPFEWRKSFNAINFVLGNIRIVYKFSVNDVDDLGMFLGNKDKKSEEDLPKVKASPQTILAIEGTAMKFRYLLNPTE